MHTTPKTIVIAGGTGFIGNALVPSLLPSFQIRVLTRGDTDHKLDVENVQWVKCDLFSLNQVRMALNGCDMAVYLVHSMLPASQLTQARFRDLDYLAADNFARAAKAAGITQIIYVGGIIPPLKKLSAHLESRREVETILESSGVPVVSLRCAMVLGAGSSSLAIVSNLVKRLPIMVCPAWTERKSSPVYITDLIGVINYYINKPTSCSVSIDVSGASVLSYRSLIKSVAECLGKVRLLFSVPVFSPRLSCLWVCIFSGAPRNLVVPLIDSLRHDMLPRVDHAPPITEYNPKDIKEALELSLPKGADHTKPYAFRVPHDEWKEQTVRSVQRLPMPRSWNALQVADAYLNWLPRALAPVLKVIIARDTCSICIKGLKRPLLTFRKDHTTSEATLAAFVIESGLLVRTQTVGALEFRPTNKGDEVLAGIHDFQPSLPWFIYRWSQALVHKWIMWRFGRYLKKQRSDGGNVT